ncbi:MAG TPA: hypothetical protein VKI62_05060 [Bacteroidota bacterium]|nr:hypothetical protein [Bacteroidota bacterium]
MALCLVVVSVTAAAPGDKNITRKEIPSAVVKAVQQRFPADSIIAQQTTTVNGKKYFVLEINGEKNHYNLLVTPEGKIYEIREAMEYSKLPAGAFWSIDQHFPRIKIVSTEKVTQDSVVTYTVRLIERGNDNATECVLDSQGKIINIVEPPRERE